MHPCIWGPSGWKFLHAITFAYPEQPAETDKASVIKFFRALPTVLPCELCSKHLLEHYRLMPPEDNIADRKTIVKWLFDIHNEVNKSLNKPLKDFNEFINETKAEADYYKSKPLNMACSKSIKLDRPLDWLLIGLILILLLLLIGTNIHRFRKVKGRQSRS